MRHNAPKPAGWGRGGERERVVFCALFGKPAPNAARAVPWATHAWVRTGQAKQLISTTIRGHTRHPKYRRRHDHLFWIDARLPFPLRVWNLPFASRRRLPAQHAQG